MADVKIVMDKSGTIKHSLGFGRRHKVQIFVDNEIRKGMDDYVPFREGYLKNSALKSIAGSGKIVYDMPYGRKQFYEGRKVEGKARGRLWSYRYAELEGKALAARTQAYIRSIT